MNNISKDVINIINYLRKSKSYKYKENNIIINDVSQRLKELMSKVEFKREGKYADRISASKMEIDYLDELTCDNNEMVITDYLRDLALIADISNNIAHSVKNKEISKRFYLLKSISVSTIHREVKNNRDTIDIIDGFKEDTINGEKVKSYVIDIPGNGQLSWHLKKNVPSELQEDYDKKYPYGIAKNDEFYNHNLLLSLLSEKNLTDHDYLVAYNEEGTENQLREILDVYYSNNYLMESDENRDKKCDAIGKKTNLSKANIDNLTKVLRVSKEKVYEYREQYIQEESIEREKRGNK